MEDDDSGNESDDTNITSEEPVADIDETLVDSDDDDDVQAIASEEPEDVDSSTESEPSPVSKDSPDSAATESESDKENRSPAVVVSSRPLSSCSARSAASDVPSNKWECPTCTYHNDARSKKKCKVCGLARSPAPKKSRHE
jgi:hypothetical protein